MAKAPSRVRPDKKAPEAGLTASELDRKEELSEREGIKPDLLKLFTEVKDGFNDQNARSTTIQDYWDIYNNKYDPGKQFYNGNSQIFMPIASTLINARKTRFANQLFPVSQRNVEVTTEDGTIPHAIVALLEDYVKKTKLRTLLPALLRNGDVEGQMSIYVDWEKTERHVVMRVPAKMQVDLGDEPDSATAVEVDGDDDMVDVKEETITIAHPGVEIIADADVLVLPQTSNSIAEALANGGSVTVLRRWTSGKIKRMMREGIIDKTKGKALLKDMQKADDSGKVDKAKEAIKAAGIQKDGRGTYLLCYETWSNLKLDKDTSRLCRTFFGGEDSILGCRRNPLWADTCPLISEPVEKVQGSFKGISKLKAVADLVYFANDTINEAADSAGFSMMPIIMTDPEKNPKIGSMILNMAAIWQTSPNDTQFAKFPELWKSGLEIVGAIKAEMSQTLNVNPAMMTQATKKKQNQAEVANELQLDVLTTADTVTVVEEGILTPMIGRFLELDHQYRTEKTTVRQYGVLGQMAAMQTIEPIQFDRRYQFRWFGVEASRSTQQVQQQIAAMNIIRGVPPQLYQGYKLNLAPLLVQLCENAFGPRLAPLIFEDLRAQLSHSPDEENTYLAQGMMMPVHPMDNHKEHMAAHLKALQATQDPHGTIREHLMKHQIALMQQAAAQQQAMQPKGQTGAPGGAGPGVPGAPRPGAQAGGPRPGPQAPPGAVRPNGMPTAMPQGDGA